MQGYLFRCLNCGKREFTRQELDAPLYGYIDVPETDLRVMPTRNSDVRRRVGQGDYFTARGCSEDGESIDGSSLWYHVLTSMSSGNRSGYIHSSFVNITSPPDGVVFCHECQIYGSLENQESLLQGESFPCWCR